MPPVQRPVAEFHHAAVARADVDRLPGLAQGVGFPVDALRRIDHAVHPRGRIPCRHAVFAENPDHAVGGRVQACRMREACIAHMRDQQRVAQQIQSVGTARGEASVRQRGDVGDEDACTVGFAQARRHPSLPHAHHAARGDHEHAARGVPGLPHAQDVMRGKAVVFRQRLAVDAVEHRDAVGRADPEPPVAVLRQGDDEIREQPVAHGQLPEGQPLRRGASAEQEKAEQRGTDGGRNAQRISGAVCRNIAGADEK